MSKVRCVFGGIGLTIAMGFGAGACAESQPPLIGEGGSGGANQVPGVCSGVEGSTECGNGCCDAGYACSAFGSCIPTTPCGADQACSSDSTCAPGGTRGNVCLPWDTFPANLRYNQQCRNDVELPSIIPDVQCSWPGDSAPSEFPDSVQVVGTPMVVDFNFDNNPTTLEPSIVFISYDGQYSQANGVIRVIDANTTGTCKLQATISGAAGEGVFRAQVSPALGDIDGDGRPEIVVADQGLVSGALRSGVAVYAWSGEGTEFELLSRVNSASSAPINGLSLHDLDDDDSPEILTQNTILRWDGRNIVSISDDGDNVRAAALEPPIVCDIDSNRVPELVTAAGVFTWDTAINTLVPKESDGALIWDEDESDDAQFVALANLGPYPTGRLGGADSVEMVAVGFSGELWVKQMDGRRLLTVDSTTGASGNLVGGPPVIADFDGDGRMEFASPGRTSLTVFDLDCVTGERTARLADCANPDGPNRNGIVWSSPIHGAQSGVAVFDFDGDKHAEVVYADQCFMRVYDGASGEVLFSVPRSSVTQWEYPVVADVDGDGKSELVTASNDNNDTVNCDDTDLQNRNAEVAFEPSHGVTVWRDMTDRWAGSRPIWNQHDYFVTNVNDDGTIPRMTAANSHWSAAGPNTFRQNVQGVTGTSLDEPDITTSGDPAFECLDGGRVKLDVSVCNRGIRTLNPGEASVTLVLTDNLQRQLCNPSITEPLLSQKCTTLSCVVPAPNANLNITIMGDSSDLVSECDESNNLSNISNVFCARGPQ